MKRYATIVALAMCLLLVTAVSPAAAKKKTPPEPTFYDVTLEITGDFGLGTCLEEGPLTMADLGGGYLMADGRSGTSIPGLYLRADVPATRTYGYVPDNDEDTFDGCHGGALPGSESSVPSYFLVYSDDDGNVNGFLWAFDVYVEEGTKGKNKTPGVKEYFRLWSTAGTATDAAGNPCPLTGGAPCEVSGVFEVYHYYPIEKIGESHFDFTLTIAPR